MELNVKSEVGMSKFKPLDRVLCYDDFDQGYCGWVELMDNLTEPGFNTRDNPIDLTRWGPVMLSSASYSFVGTHGSMSGIYSLKLATRPVANPYEEPPAPGNLSCTLKRLTGLNGLKQLEMWFAYSPEQDRFGIGERDVRAFGVIFDIQDHDYRYFPGVRYLNSVNGEAKGVWQYSQAADVTHEQWCYGKRAWGKRGIDPQWYGRRHSDGSTDGWKFLAEGEQRLCYNESDDKINWMYFRLLIDSTRREYVEMECGDRVFDLRGIKPTLVDPYPGITGLFNPVIFVETDTDRRVFLYVDSIVVSTEQSESPSPSPGHPHFGKRGQSDGNGKRAAICTSCGTPLLGDSGKGES